MSFMRGINRLRDPVVKAAALPDGSKFSSIPCDNCVTVRLTLIASL